MSSHTSTPATGVSRLESAFRVVLAGDFEDQVRALVENRAWYSAELPGSEVFRLWISDNLTSRDDLEWIFQPIRAGERKFLCEQLGIDRTSLVGRDGRQVADLLLRAAGLPSRRLGGWERRLALWREAIDLIAREEDERAAVLLRQRAERVLRITLHFYCATGLAAHLLAILKDPGELLVPKRIRDLGSAGMAPEDELVDAFLEEGWADLGFLALALRKLSARVEGQGIVHVTGAHLILFRHTELESVQKLARSLQPYTHDRPSQQEVRRRDLQVAADETLATLEALIRRAVLPNELLVIATGSTIFGPAFKGLTDKGKLLTLVSPILPGVGDRLLFAASTERDFAGCVWVKSPWPDVG